MEREKMVIGQIGEAFVKGRGLNSMGECRTVREKLGIYSIYIYMKSSIKSIYSSLLNFVFLPETKFISLVILKQE